MRRTHFTDDPGMLGNDQHAWLSDFSVDIALDMAVYAQPPLKLTSPTDIGRNADQAIMVLLFLRPNMISPHKFTDCWVRI